MAETEIAEIALVEDVEVKGKIGPTVKKIGPTVKNHQQLRVGKRRETDGNGFLLQKLFCFMFCFISSLRICLLKQ